MNNLEDIRESYYTVKDGHDARCPECGAIDIGIEQSINRDGKTLIYYVCEADDCGMTFL